MKRSSWYFSKLAFSVVSEKGLAMCVWACVGGVLRLGGHRPFLRLRGWRRARGWLRGVAARARVAAWIAARGCAGARGPASGACRLPGLVVPVRRPGPPRRRRAWLRLRARMVRVPLCGRRGPRAPRAPAPNPRRGLRWLRGTALAWLRATGGEPPLRDPFPRARAVAVRWDGRREAQLSAELSEETGGPIRASHGSSWRASPPLLRPKKLLIGGFYF